MRANRDGPAGALAALRQSAPLPVGMGVLVGPDAAGAAAGVMGGAAPGPGGQLDGAIADLAARVLALEQAEAGEVT